MLADWLALLAQVLVGLALEAVPSNLLSLRLGALLAAVGFAARNCRPSDANVPGWPPVRPFGDGGLPLPFGGGGRFPLGGGGLPFGGGGFP